MENFIDNFVRMPLSLLLNGTKVTYETIYSVPLSILRENVYLISISLYLIWYIKAYLSVSYKFFLNLFKANKKYLSNIFDKSFWILNSSSSKSYTNYYYFLGKLNFLDKVPHEKY